MTIGRADDKRRDLLAVLALARQHEGQVTPELICRELLLGRPQVVGKKVVERCADLGLLSPDGGLTDAGRDALATGEVFIPETGKYRVWVSSDPLVPGKLLGIEPVPEVNAPEANLDAKRRRNERGDGGRFAGGPIDLPDTVTGLPGHVFTSFLGLSGRVRVLSVEQKGEALPVEASLSKCRLEWTVSPVRASSVQVADGFNAKFDPPRISFDQVWFQVLGEEARNWVEDEKGGYLKTRFSDETLQDAERMNLRRSKLFRPELEGLGEFDQITVGDIPIYPATFGDANSWARWIQERSVTQYLDRASFKILNSHIEEQFPGFKVRLLSRQDLAKRLADSVRISDGDRFPTAYWFLRAAFDLGDGVGLEEEE
jgi:hypothetical protein